MYMYMYDTCAWTSNNLLNAIFAMPIAYCLLLIACCLSLFVAVLFTDHPLSTTCCLSHVACC